jgi:hypothetical protein
MEKLALKRYRVTAAYVSEESWTVFARDPNHAVALVKEGAGRPAGIKQPQLAGFKVQEYGFVDGKQKEIAGAAEEVEKGRIIV